MRTIRRRNAVLSSSWFGRRMPGLVLALFLLPLLIGGCATSNTRVQGSSQLKGVQRYFVISNSNDSRALDRHIANALRAHGLTADSGPRTMKPDDTQAVVVYEDHWSWDFGERLQVLQLTVRDARSGNTLATAQFSAKIPGRQPPAVVADVVARLLGGDGG